MISAQKRIISHGSLVVGCLKRVHENLVKGGGRQVRSTNVWAGTEALDA